MLNQRRYVIISAVATFNAILLTGSNSAVRGFSASSISNLREGVAKKDLSSPPNVQVFDNVLTAETCSMLHQEANQIGLGHRVFSRPKKASANTNVSSVVERTIGSILRNLGDDSQFTEYWTRQEWRNIHAHADIDEYLAKRHGTELDFRYPINAHVLYLQVGQKVKGPTCIFPGRRSGGDLLRPTMHNSTGDGADVKLVTVPAVEGRLLRFNGDCLHAVCRPTDLWLLNFVQGSPDFYPEEDWGRSVILFNTWGSKPPLEVPIDEHFGSNLDAETIRFASCNKVEDWKLVYPLDNHDHDLSIVSDADKGKRTNAKIWLLGDFRRRDHQMQTVKLSAPNTIRAALEEKSKVSCLTLNSVA
jgi:hypothetical protein